MVRLQNEWGTSHKNGRYDTTTLDCRNGRCRCVYRLHRGQSGPPLLLFLVLIMYAQFPKYEVRGSRYNAFRSWERLWAQVSLQANIAHNVFEHRHTRCGTFADGNNVTGSCTPLMSHGCLDVSLWVRCNFVIATT